MTKDLLVARRYAQALFEIAKLTHQDVEMEEELGAFSKALKHAPEIETFLKNPSLSAEDKRKTIGKIYQERVRDLYEILLNFFTLLLEKNRFALIHDIAREFKQIADHERGIGEAEIRTAVALSAQSETAIVSRLEKIAGYKIRVKKEVDPALIGGVIVKVRNKIIDGSVKNRIHNLKTRLLRPPQLRFAKQNGGGSQ